MKHTFRYILVWLAAILLNIGCDHENNLPVVQSSEINKIVHNSAIFWGNVSESGNSFVFRQGACISEQESPALDDTVVESNSDGLGDFQCAIVDLNPNTEYHVRAFAENNYGVTYGEVTSFRSKNIDNFLDERDDNVYPVIQLGSDLWLAENLRFSVPGSSYSPFDDENDIAKYGYLYPFEIAQDVCPSGWHLPSDEEWKELESYLGIAENELDNVLSRGLIEGNHLKVPGNKYWKVGNDGATNEIGFSSFPAGNTSDEGIIQNLGEAAFYWTSTYDNEGIWIRYLRADESGIGRNKLNSNISCSVRCVKD